MRMKELLLYIKKHGWDPKYIFEKLKYILQSKEKIENKDLVLFLCYAALNQDKKIIELFYEEIIEFDINVKNNESQTAMELVLKEVLTEADQNKKARALAFLFKYGLNENLLIECSRDKTQWNHYVVNAQKQVLLPDGAGNTLLHYIILSKDEEAFKEFESYFVEHIPRRFGEEVNKQNQTAADMAYKLEMSEVAKTLCVREFEESPFYLYLKNLIRKRKELLSNSEKVIAYKNAMRAEINRLSQTIRFTPSLLDETFKQLLRDCQIEFQDGFEGVEITLTPELLQKVSQDNAEQLYFLTPIGKLEASLKEKFRENLVEYVESEEGLLKDMEKGFNEAQKERWSNYETAKDAYDEEYDGEGNDGYVSEEPPSPPSDSEFDPGEAREEINYEYDEEMLTDLNKLYHQLFKPNHYENGAIGSRLYHCFADSNFLLDMYYNLDFNRYHLDATQGYRTLLEINFDFPDVDVTTPRFLIKILLDNLERAFDENFYHAECTLITEKIIQKIAVNQQYSELVRKFNRAKDDGDMQKVWMMLGNVVSTICALLKTSEKDSKEVLERKLRSDTVLGQDSKEVEWLKTFPTDESSTLMYSEAQISLKPIFKTLFSVAKETHAFIEKARQPKKPRRKNGAPKVAHEGDPKDQKEENESTNVVSAVLIFAVSFVSDFSYDSKRKHHFIPIPLKFDYPSPLVSRDKEDQVFQNEHAYHHSIGEDREEGGRIVGKIPQIDVAAQATVAKTELKKFLSLFKFLDADCKGAIESIDRAFDRGRVEVAQPLALEYYSKKENVDKMTKFYHSERVILHALKNPENVKKILEYIFDACKKLSPNFEALNKIKLNAASLLFYSYPNSVCSECSLGFLALQNSYQKGFIKLLVDAISQPGSPFVMAWSRRRDLQPYPKFKLTVVGSSKNIFNSDYSGQQIERNPAAKLDLIADGICIRRKKNVFEPRKYFYEFVKSLVHEADEHTTYQGIVAMSGSKLAKIKNAQSREVISEDLKNRMEEINRTAKQMQGMLPMSPTGAIGSMDPMKSMQQMCPVGPMLVATLPLMAGKDGKPEKESKSQKEAAGMPQPKALAGTSTSVNNKKRKLGVQ